MKKPLVARLRTYHRWIAAGAMLVLTWIAVTGLALMLDLLTEPHFPPPPPQAELPLEAMAVLASDAARRAAAAAASPTEVVVKVGQAEGAPRLLAAQASKGTETTRLLAEPPRRPPGAYLQFRIKLHVLLERLHRGNILGLPGQFLSVLGALSFLFLTVSGVWMYVDLLLKRRRLGRAGLFWKA
ncbi:MAG: PepSY domain-containing protein [Caulobacter sp.]